MLPKYKRVLLKLSGESLMGDKQYGIDPSRLAIYAEEIAGQAKNNVQIDQKILFDLFINFSQNLNPSLPCLLSTRSSIHYTSANILSQLPPIPFQKMVQQPEGLICSLSSEAVLP